MCYGIRVHAMVLSRPLLLLALSQGAICDCWME